MHIVQRNNVSKHNSDVKVLLALWCKGVSKGYFKTARGNVIYSPRAQPEVNKSRAHEVS